MGLNDDPPSITVGTDVEPDALFWNTMTPGNYTDGGTDGVGIFRRDTVWTPYTPAVTFNATPFPGGGIYDSVPSHRTNNPSQPFQAQQTSEFGDEVSFAGTLRDLTAVTVGMSTWAKHSEWMSMAQSGWSHPITLNIYAVDESGPNPALGPLLATKTVTFDFPWRPESDPTCPGGGTAWRAGDNMCYNGLGFTITFDFTTSSITLPNKVIYGIVYNTFSWGPNPIGILGPYDSLNVELNNVPPSIVVGTDVEPDAVFWNTATLSLYTDPGPGCCIFRRDTVWAPYTPAVTFRATNANTTAVQVRSFTATRARSDVVLRWRTGSEAGALGFNVFRNGVRLNTSLIAARGSLAGATYRFTASGHPARAVYRLQAVYTNGSRSFLARVTTQAR